MSTDRATVNDAVNAAIDTTIDAAIKATIGVTIKAAHFPTFNAANLSTDGFPKHTTLYATVSSTLPSANCTAEYAAVSTAVKCSHISAI